MVVISSMDPMEALFRGWIVSCENYASLADAASWSRQEEVSAAEMMMTYLMPRTSLWRLKGDMSSPQQESWVECVPGEVLAQEEGEEVALEE